MAKKISRKSLIQALQDLAEQLGEPPTTVEMNKQGRYSKQPYETEFGSWNAAVKLLALKSLQNLATAFNMPHLIANIVTMNMR